MQVRVCRDCGEEFRPEVAVCSDCGGVLETRDDEHDDSASSDAERPRFGGFVPEARPGGIPAGYVAVASAPNAVEVQPLAERLAEAGIAFALNASTQTFSILVPEADVEKALAALGMAPAEPGDVPVACPACGAAIREGVVECPDCGLGLGQQEP